MDISKTERIRALNDRLRTQGEGGNVVVTRGIAALEPSVLAAVLGAVQSFDAFNADNDPYSEHDFGSLDVSGERIMFKIDYYDRSMLAHSPDPSDAAVTVRVLTILLADEY